MRIQREERSFVAALLRMTERAAIEPTLWGRVPRLRDPRVQVQKQIQMRPAKAGRYNRRT